MKVVRTLARDLPWNFHVCPVLPLIFQGLASHLFVRKRQHGNRRYAMDCI